MNLESSVTQFLEGFSCKIGVKRRDNRGWHDFGTAIA
jgi:hypothetical protein